MKLGKLSVRDEVLAAIAGAATIDSYGLATMVSQNQVRESISGWFGHDNPGRGVGIKAKGESVVVDVHIVVTYGTRISEVARNVMDKVIYQFGQQVGCVPERVNVFVQGVRLPDEQ